MAPRFGQPKSFVNTFKKASVFSSNRKEETLRKLIFDGCQTELHHPSTCERVSVHDQMRTCVLIQVEVIWSTC